MRKIIPVLCLSVFFVLGIIVLPLFADESISIVTYYPSPYGSYNQLYVADKLGIGTTSPNDELQVVGTLGVGKHSSNQLYRYVLDAESSSNSYLSIGYKSTVDGWYTGNPALTLTYTGNIGIGTTSPYATLHITKDNWQAINLGGSSDPSTDQGNRGITWGYRSDGNPYYMIKTNYKAYTNPIGQSYTYSRLQIGWHTGIEMGASSTYGGIRFFTNSPGVGSPAQIGGINDGGYTYFLQSVGIGTTYPTEKLQVYGTGNSISLSDVLPGYAAGLYTCLKTTGSWLYFSVNGAYSAYMTSDGTITKVSDRDKKENFVAVDPQQILAKIDSMPMYQWNFKDQDPSVRHIAPVAQDFYAAFGLNGNNDKMISDIDPSGVALVGVKALSSQLKAQQEQAERFQQELDSLKAELRSIKDES